jgi:hypothetical protein
MIIDGRECETVATIQEPWRSWLGSWRDELDPDLPVVFYADDGTDSPDEWADGPHLAVCTDHEVDGERRGLVWPVDVEGWADAKAIGWAGVLQLITKGERQAGS